MTNIKKYSEFKEDFPSENLQYHIENKISILDNVFRPYSESFYSLIKEAKKLSSLLTPEDREILESTDLGEFANYNDEIVPLDLPMENEDIVTEAEHHGKSVKLNHPTRSSGPKKYKVYVRDPKSGNVKVVNFGDVKGGLSAKISDPKARKAFAARHQCHLKKDKTKPGYWACHLGGKVLVPTHVD